MKWNVSRFSDNYEYIQVIKPGFRCFNVYYQETFQVKQDTEAIVQRCFVKKVFLQISQNLQENTSVGFFFLIKLKASACNVMTKRGSGTDVFL